MQWRGLERSAIVQVVDFRFNPSTGQVCSLIYDKTSLPLPRFAVLKLVDLWSTGAQHVRSVDSARLRITLKPGHKTIRRSAGWLEWVFSRLQVCPPPPPHPPSPRGAAALRGTAHGCKRLLESSVSASKCWGKSVSLAQVCVHYSLESMLFAKCRMGPPTDCSSFRRLAAHTGCSFLLVLASHVVSAVWCFCGTCW